MTETATQQEEIPHLETSATTFRLGWPDVTNTHPDGSCVAWCPPLGLSAAGRSREEAREALHKQVRLTWEAFLRSGNLDLYYGPPPWGTPP